MHVDVADWAYIGEGNAAVVFAYNGHDTTKVNPCKCILMMQRLQGNR